MSDMNRAWLDTEKRNKFLIAIVAATIIGGVFGWLRLSYPLAKFVQAFFPSLWDYRSGYLSVVTAGVLSGVFLLFSIFLSKALTGKTFFRSHAINSIILVNCLVFFTAAQAFWEGIKVWGLRLHVLRHEDFLVAIVPMPFLLLLLSIGKRKNNVRQKVVPDFVVDPEEETWGCPKCRHENLNDTYVCELCHYSLL